MPLTSIVSRLASPWRQNIIASILLALGPGVFTALTCLGAGGGAASAVNAANIVYAILYGVFAAGSFFSSSIISRLGLKWAFMIASSGYPVLVASFWYLDKTSKIDFPVVAGAFAGFCSSLMWTCGGFISYSYPPENKKGKFISTQWIICGVGSLVGASIALGVDYHAAVERVPLAMYITFICLMACGLFVAAVGIVKPAQVCRPDGSGIADYLYRGFMNEFKAQLRLFRDWRLLLFIIPLLGCDIGIIVNSTLNAMFFNVRMRSVNVFVFNVAQVLSPDVIGRLLDWERIGTRRRRGIVAVVVTVVIIVAGGTGLLIWIEQNPFDPENPPLLGAGSKFYQFMMLNVAFGINAGIYNIVAQWILAALSNDAEELARWAGFSQGWIAAGLCTSYALEAGNVSQKRIAIFTFVLQIAGLICMLVGCIFFVKPTCHENTDEETQESAATTRDTSTWSSVLNLNETKSAS